MGWLVFAAAAFFGCLAAPWYAPAAIAAFYLIVSAAMIAGTMGRFPIVALEPIGAIVALIFAAWGVGRGLERLFRRRRKPPAPIPDDGFRMPETVFLNLRRPPS